jgi:hypothetical protein
VEEGGLAALQLAGVEIIFSSNFGRNMEGI